MNIVIYIVTYTKQERRHCLIYKKTTAIVYIQYIYIYIYNIQSIQLLIYLYLYNEVPTNVPMLLPCRAWNIRSLNNLRLMYEWYHHVPSYFLLTSILYIVVYFLKELNICESILRIREYANTSGILEYHREYWPAQPPGTTRNTSLFS